MKFVAITEEILNKDYVRDSDFLLGVCQATLAMYPAGGPLHPWAGYLVESDQELVVGACAFKSAPNGRGVEIAYFTFPEHEGKGLATEMARELVHICRSHGVTPVTAQTLPLPNASTRILEKLGFVMTGSVMHPEDGEVWEWQLE
jgi:RimJ/RimL family protein N-acetyltransferase